MKKIALLAIFVLYICCGCVSSKSLENNLNQMRIAKADDIVETGKTDEERAQDIKEKLLMQMDEIKAAAVVVESHTALIGLRLKEDKEYDEAELKKKAGILAKQFDESVLGTSVTTNERITHMIEELERKRQ